MAKGTGTYDDPILVDGIFAKTINGVKKFFKINSNGNATIDDSNYAKINKNNFFTASEQNIINTVKTGTDTNEIHLLCRTVNNECANKNVDNYAYNRQIYIFSNPRAVGIQIQQHNTQKDYKQAIVNLNQHLIAYQFASKNKYLFHRNFEPTYEESDGQLCIRFPFKVQIICYEKTISKPTQEKYSFNFLKPFAGKPYTIKSLATYDNNMSQSLNTTLPQTNMSSMEMYLNSSVIGSTNIRFQIMIIGAYE